MDMEYIRRESVFGTRVAPGVLTFALAEGLTLQTGILHGTGLALLSYDVRVLAPVLAGDTMSVEIEVGDRRGTPKLDRGGVKVHPRAADRRGAAGRQAPTRGTLKARAGRGAERGGGGRRGGGRRLLDGLSAGGAGRPLRPDSRAPLPGGGRDRPLRRGDAAALSHRRELPHGASLATGLPELWRDHRRRR